MDIVTHYKKSKNSAVLDINTGCIPTWIYYTYEYLKNLDLNDKKILDVGCGDGFLLRKLKNVKNIKPYGVDLSAYNVQFLKKQGIKAHSIDISKKQLPYRNNYFDYVIFTEVIEHLFDCQHAVNEIYRVLKKNGIFIISTHNAFNLYMRIKFFLGFIPTSLLDPTFNKGEHIRLFNKSTLLKILRNACFRDISDESYFKWNVIQFKTYPFTSLLSRHLFFVCKK